MEKLFDAVINTIPAPVLPALLAIGVAFFGVYYYFAYRNYTDVLHDKAFLSLVTLIVCASILFHINSRQNIEHAAADIRPALVVPNFENDERDQYKNIFLQHIRSSFSEAGLDAESVVEVDAFLTDRKSAELQAERLKSSSVIYQPRVVVTSEVIYICVSLLMPGHKFTKAYPPTAVEIDAHVLQDIVSTVFLSQPPMREGVPNPLLARLESLERQFTELQSAILDAEAAEPQSLVHDDFPRKYALVVGNNQSKDDNLPVLQFAVSDAQKLGGTLETLGFNVTILTNPESEDVKTAFKRVADLVRKDDLFVFYYAGSGVRASDLVNGQKGTLQSDALILPTYDFSIENGRENFSLDDVVNSISDMRNTASLVVLDGCHGTTGLSASDYVGVGDGRILQILAGSQDDGYAFETSEAGGGQFTHTFVSELRDLHANTGRVPVKRLAANVTRATVERSKGLQKPKFVSLGEGDIVF